MTSTTRRTVQLHLVTIDCTDIATHQQQVPLACKPFSSGKWTVTFKAPQYTGGMTQLAKIVLKWEGCEVNADWTKVQLVANGAQLNQGNDYSPAHADFPGCKDGTRTAFIYRQCTSLKVALEVDAELDSTATIRCLAMIDGKDVTDVCLAFPGASRQLFASSARLSEISPWWKTVRATRGFSENVSSRQTPSELHEDSDAEEEDEIARTGEKHTRLPPSPPESPRSAWSPGTSPSSIRTIPITGTPYAVYRAMLYYLYTDHIAFAPLTSTFFVPSPGTNPVAPAERLAKAKQTRAASIEAHKQLHPNTPLPISPKSLFLLAHFLEIPFLISLSLAALHSALTPENIAYELFSISPTQPLGALYDEIWEVEVAFARQHWADVKTSTGMKEEKQRIEGEGASEYEVRTLWALLGVKEAQEGEEEN
ncbi:hypothetical protein JCM11641_004485 [Rhodosporidiobolus odoratus]